ncbi:MAG TPA: GNAT family N-acetyltransferase [Mycobacteriales bacterium]|nr:GNAT family N-acetyltransferase [Mycobacteriales bacterium]
MIVTQISVRPGEAGDLPVLTALYNHYVEQTHVTFDTHPFSVEQRRGWFSHYASAGAHRLLVAEVGGDLVGYATSSKFRDKTAYDTSVEVTVYVRDGAARGGVGSALYTALFDALHGEDVHRAYAGIALPNDASMALHRRFGFAEVGTYREVGRKFGRYWDVTWLEKPV